MTKLLQITDAIVKWNTSISRVNKLLQKDRGIGSDPSAQRTAAAVVTVDDDEWLEVTIPMSILGTILVGEIREAYRDLLANGLDRENLPITDMASVDSLFRLSGLEGTFFDE